MLQTDPEVATAVIACAVPLSPSIEAKGQQKLKEEVYLPLQRQGWCRGMPGDASMRQMRQTSSSSMALPRTEGPRREVSTTYLWPARLTYYLYRLSAVHLQVLLNAFSAA